MQAVRNDSQSSDVITMQTRIYFADVNYLVRDTADGPCLFLRNGVHDRDTIRRVLKMSNFKLKSKLQTVNGERYYNLEVRDGKRKAKRKRTRARHLSS